MATNEPEAAEERGVVINISSGAAYEGSIGQCAYAASKAAAVAMIDSLAADVKGTGLTVNSILPSIIDTPVNRRHGATLETMARR